MRRYETIFILRPNVGEEEINKVIESTTEIILDEKGTIIDLNKWGMKKLAYLIKKESLGYYVFCDYAATPAAVAEIERKFRIDDLVMKYMTVKIADAINSDQIQQAVAEVTARDAAVAESEEEAAADSADSDTPVQAEKVDSVEKTEETTTED